MMCILLCYNQDFKTPKQTIHETADYSAVSFYIQESEYRAKASGDWRDVTWPSPVNGARSYKIIHKRWW